MSNELRGWEAEVRGYCKAKNLSFEKAKEMEWSTVGGSLNLRYHTLSTDGQSLWISVLIVEENEDDRLEFTMTEYTRQYLIA